MDSQTTADTEKSPDEQETPGSPKTPSPQEPDGPPAFDSQLVLFHGLRRACDCCRRRKIKCDGKAPCEPCNKASLRCAYLTPPKKKGPKGLRSAKILHALRHTDDRPPPPPPPPPPLLNGEPKPRLNAWDWPSVPQDQFMHQVYPRTVQYGPRQLQVDTTPPQRQRLDTSVGQYCEGSPHRLDSAQSWTLGPDPFSNVPVNPQLLGGTKSRRLPGEVLYPYVQLFFKHIAPHLPVFDSNLFLNPRMYDPHMELRTNHYSLICALSAVTAIQLKSLTMPALRQDQTNAEVLVEECLADYTAFSHVASPSLVSMLTSYLLSLYFSNTENHNQEWYFLQMSITMAEMRELDTEQCYKKIRPPDSEWAKRMYWILFVAERTCTLHRRKRFRLQPILTLPEEMEYGDQQPIESFVTIANLHRLLDDQFVNAWQGPRQSKPCNEAWLKSIQKSLDIAAVPPVNLSQSQILGIVITHAWLQVLTWQTGVSYGLIYGQGEGSLALDYPIVLASKAVVYMTSASTPASESHGIGIELKLCDIACCVADVLQCTADESCYSYHEGRRYLRTFLSTLHNMRGKDSAYLGRLMTRAEGLVGRELPQSLPLPVEPTMESSAGLPDDPPRTRGVSLSEVGVQKLRSLSVSVLPAPPWQNLTSLEGFPDAGLNGMVYGDDNANAFFQEQQPTLDGQGFDGHL